MRKNVGVAYTFWVLHNSFVLRVLLRKQLFAVGEVYTLAYLRFFWPKLA
ncbi:MAG: hypothetical protein BWX84_01699 [Verrucomicrobia bacterium ADurb.Bin118]|nr:MAG: hypothetical protein BWX84_01699 [Verrucomicrobia bacterium ADurb.Bin118]